MIIAGRMVTPDGVVNGQLRTTGDLIAEIIPTGSGPDHWLLPGFVDIHNHGGGGHGFSTGDPTAARSAATFHLRHGTTTLLASLVSAPIPRLCRTVRALAPLVAEGVLAGLHLEGPYLSHSRRGAQPARFLRDPDPGELARLLATEPGTIRMVTLAPERPGALAAISFLVAQDVVAAIGHTDADYQQTRAAVAAGASVATHLFNGMPPVHHRAPGPVPALLGAPGVVCELVADGAHLHDGILAFAIRAAGPGGAALVTDAISAAGMPDGEYELAGQPVIVANQVARLAQPGAPPNAPPNAQPGAPPGVIAGSALTMDAALRRAVAAGVPLMDAVKLAATTPARAIGLADVAGALLPGRRADLVVLDPDLHVCRVMRAGQWCC